MSSQSRDSQCCKCLASRDPSAHVLVVDQGIVPPSPDLPRNRNHSIPGNECPSVTVCTPDETCLPPRT